MPQPEFKIGDRVRLNQPYGGYLKGAEDVVTGVETSDWSVTNANLLVRTNSFSCFDHRLELVEARPKTDEELVAEYRRLRIPMDELLNEFKQRGFTPRRKSDHVALQNPIPADQVIFCKNVEIIL